MNIFGQISLVIVFLSFFFSIFLIIRPRGEKYFNIDKVWVVWGGIGLLLLAVIFFYVAGFQPNNVVQNITVNGVVKSYVVQTMDLPGGAYFDFINWIGLFTFLVYIVSVIKESSILGTVRQNKRTTTRN